MYLEQKEFHPDSMRWETKKDITINIIRIYNRISENIKNLITTKFSNEIKIKKQPHFGKVEVTFLMPRINNPNRIITEICTMFPELGWIRADVNTGDRIFLQFEYDNIDMIIDRITESSTFTINDIQLNPELLTTIEMVLIYEDI